MRGPLVSAALGLAGLVSFAAPILAQADPFYLSRLAEGELALARGDHRGAVKELRIGCFGFLREPELLGRCLATLVLAESRAGDREGAMRSFGRLVEAEAVVQAWSRASLSEETRLAFVREAGLVLPEAQLANLPAFAQLLDAKRGAVLAGLSGNALRRALRERVDKEPEVVYWAEELARFELEQGRAGDAIEVVDRALTRGSQSDQLACTGGFAAHQLERWERAAVGLARCPISSAGLELVEAWLEVGRGEDATRVWGLLPPELRDSARGVLLQARLPSPPAALPSPTSEREEPPPSAEELGEVVAPSPSPTPLATEAEVEALFAQLKVATEVASVRRVLAQAQELAERGAPAAWHIAAEAAYRLSLWNQAVELFQRGGNPPRAEQQFYFAVALFEAGEVSRARVLLEQATPHLKRNDYVERMIARIGAGEHP